MKRIGKVSVALLTALFAVMILMPMAKPAQASIENWMWLPPYVTEGTYVNGTTAKMKVAVKCPTYVGIDYWENIVVTAVSIVFYQWGDINKSLSTSTTIEKEKWSFLEVSFTTNTEEFTELMSHYFYIQVNFKINGSKPDRWLDYGSGFKVISQNQKDAMELEDKFQAYKNAYPAYYFYTVSGRVLASQAIAEAAIAENLWDTKDFAGAKSHYQTAVDLYEEAFDIDGDKGMTWQEAGVNATSKQADAAMLSAQALMNQAYGYILVGLGFVLIGVGAIVYGMKKPKAAQA